MKAVNAATKMALSMFIGRANTMPLDQHPYTAMTKCLPTLNTESWTEDAKKPALAAMTFWITSILGDSIASTLNEILAVMRIAHRAGDEGKNAAEELAGSMPFLEKMASAYINEVDINYIAEQLFEDGQRRTEAGQIDPIEQPNMPKNEDEQPPPGDAIRPGQVKKQIQNWLPTRLNPSSN